ncbi:MAG: ABC transporter permease [Herbinix sp.]|nr:ABC transporter permease [Herbinix sp.]
MINIVIKEVKEFCTDKKIWIGILTVLIIIIIGTSYNKQNTEIVSNHPLRLGIINHDKSTYSEILLANFNESKTFTSLAKVSAGDEKEIKESFEKEELDVYLEIPKDFAENMMNIKNSPIKVTMNISDTTKAILFQNVLKSYEKYIKSVEANAVGLYDIMQQDGMDQEQIKKTNRAISINLILTALGRETFFSFQPVEQFPSTTLVIYYISSILVMALLYSGLYVGFRILKELEQGTFTRLRTTKTPMYQFVTAKMVLFVILLTLVAAVGISIIEGEPVNGKGILFCLAIALICVCQAALLSALLYNNQRFVLAGNLMIFFFAVLGGGIIPIQYLPQDIMLIAKFTPNYYILKELIYLLNGQYRDIYILSAVLILLSASFAGAAVIIFERRRVVYDEV